MTVSGRMLIVSFKRVCDVQFSIVTRYDGMPFPGNARTVNDAHLPSGNPHHVDLLYTSTSTSFSALPLEIAYFSYNVLTRQVSSTSSSLPANLEASTNFRRPPRAHPIGLAKPIYNLST